MSFGLLLSTLLVASGPSKGVVVDRADRPVHVIAAGKASARHLLDPTTAPGLKDAAMTELVMLPGCKVPEHVHETSDEILYILEGHGTMTMDKKKLEVRAGMAIYIPRGTKHSMQLETKVEPLRAIQVYTPGGPEQRFKKGPTSKE